MRYFSETIGRGLFAVIRSINGGRTCVHMTSSELEARRMAVELNRADELAFREGLIVGHAETVERRAYAGWRA